MEHGFFNTVSPNHIWLGIYLVHRARHFKNFDLYGVITIKEKWGRGEAEFQIKESKFHFELPCKKRSIYTLGLPP